MHGLKELIEEHPNLLQLHLTVLMNNCARVIGDEVRFVWLPMPSYWVQTQDAGVRTTLLGFLGWLLPRIPPVTCLAWEFNQFPNTINFQQDLIPHSPVLLLFATSAQTHIFPEIRIDAIRCLDLLLEHIPEVVVEGWGQGTKNHGGRVLEGYLGILNAGTKIGEGGGKLCAFFVFLCLRKTRRYWPCSSNLHCECRPITKGIAIWQFVQYIPIDWATYSQNWLFSTPCHVFFPQLWNLWTCIPGDLHQPGFSQTTSGHAMPLSRSTIWSNPAMIRHLLKHLPRWWYGMKKLTTTIPMKLSLANFHWEITKSLTGACRISIT